MENKNKEFSLRERFVITIAVFLIKMIKPWQYDHQFTKFWDELKEIINN